MEKMKRSLKYVLISVALVVVFAVATVATVLLLRKPGAPAMIEQFTVEQRIMLNKLTENNTLKKNESTKTFVEAVSVRDENNQILSQDDIYAYYDGYFVAYDESGNKLLYLETSSGNVNVLGKLQAEQKLKNGAENISAIRVSGKYLLYSYNFAESEIDFKAYEVVDFSNISQLTIKNSIVFKVEDDKLFDQECEVSDVEFDFYKEYFEISYLKSDNVEALADNESSLTYVKNLYIYGSNTANQTFEYENANQIETDQSKSENANVIINTTLDGNAKFSFKTLDENQNETFKTFSYLTEDEIDYRFYATNQGVFIQKKTISDSSLNDKAVLEEDGKNYVYTYEFFNLKTMTVEAYELEEDVVYAEFDSVGEYLVVFAKTKNYKSMSEYGILAYIDVKAETTENIIISYQASSIDSKILYSNNTRFVTNDGIYATDKKVSATKMFSFKADDYDLRIESEVITSDWFVVRDEIGLGAYICGMDGKPAYDEVYVSIVDFGDGYFLTTKNGKRHLCVPAENQQNLVEDYVISFDVELPSFGFYLVEKSAGGNRYDVYNHKNERIETDVQLETVVRENYIALIATKQDYSKMYLLKINEEYGNNTYRYAKNTNNQSEDEIEIQPSSSIEPYDGTTTEPPHEHAEKPTEATLDIDPLIYSGGENFTSKAKQMTTGSYKKDSSTEMWAYTYPKYVTVDLKNMSYTSSNTATANYKSYCKEECGLSYIESYTYDTPTKKTISDVTGRVFTFSSWSYNNDAPNRTYTLKYTGATSSETFTCIASYTNVRSDGTLTFSYSKSYGNIEYNLTSQNCSITIKPSKNADGTDNVGYFQPQEEIEYDVTFHNDTPYWATAYTMTDKIESTYIGCVNFLSRADLLRFYSGDNSPSGYIVPDESYNTYVYYIDDNGNLNQKLVTITVWELGDEDGGRSFDFCIESPLLETKFTYYCAYETLPYNSYRIIILKLNGLYQALNDYVTKNGKLPIPSYGGYFNYYSDVPIKDPSGKIGEQHNCYITEDGANEGCVTKTVRYFDWAEINKGLDESNEVQKLKMTGIVSDAPIYSSLGSYTVPSVDHYIFRGWKLERQYTLDNGYSAPVDNTDANYTQYAHPGALKQYDGYALGAQFGTTFIDICPIWEGVELTIRFYVSKQSNSNAKQPKTDETKIQSIDLYSTTSKGITIQSYDDLSYNSELRINANTIKMEQVDSKIKNPKPDDLLTTINAKALTINEKYWLISENYVLTGWQLAKAMEETSWITNGVNLDCSSYGPDDYYSDQLNRISTSITKNSSYSKTKSYIYVVPSFTERDYGFRIETSNQTQSDLASLDSGNNLTLNQAHNESIIGYVSNETIVNDSRTYESGEGGSSYVVSTISIKTKDEQGNNIAYPEMYYAFTTVTIKGYKYSHGDKTDNYTSDFNHIFVYDYFEKKWSKFAFGINELNPGAKTNLAANASNVKGSDIILITEDNAAKEIGDVTRYSTSAKLVLKIRTRGSDESGVASNDYGMLGSVYPGALQPVYEPYHDINVSVNGTSFDSFSTSYGNFLSGFDIFNAGEGDFGTEHPGYAFEIEKNGSGNIQYSTNDKSVTISGTTKNYEVVDMINQRIPKTSEGDQNIPKDDGVVADGASGAENYEFEDESKHITKDYTVDYKSTVLNSSDPTKTTLYCMAMSISFCSGHPKYYTGNVGNTRVYDLTFYKYDYSGSIPYDHGPITNNFSELDNIGNGVVLHPMCEYGNLHAYTEYIFSWGGEGSPSTWDWGVKLNTDEKAALGIVQWKKTDMLNLLYGSNIYYNGTVNEGKDKLTYSDYFYSPSFNDSSNYYYPYYSNQGYYDYSENFTYIFKAESFNQQVSATTYDPTAFVNNSKVVAIEPKYVDVSKSEAVENIVANGKIISTYLSKIKVGSKTINLSNILDYHINGDSAITNKWQDRQTSDWTEITDYNSFGTIKYKTRDPAADDNVKGERDYNIILGQKFETDYGEIMIFVGRLKPSGAQSPYEYKYVYFLIFDGSAVNSYNYSTKGVKQNTLELTMTNIDYGKIERDVTDRNNNEYNETSSTNLTYQNSYNSNISLYQINADNKTKNKTPSGYSDKVLVENINIENFSYIKLKPQFNNATTGANIGFLIEEIKIELIPKKAIFSNSIIRTYKLDYNNTLPAVTLDGSGASAKFDLSYVFEDSTGDGIPVKYMGKEEIVITDLCYFLFAAPGTNQTIHGRLTLDSDSEIDGSVWLGFSKLLDDIKISYKVVSYLDVLMKQNKNVDVESYLKNQNYVNAFNHDDYQSDYNLNSNKKENSWFDDTTLTQIYLKDISRTPGTESLYLYTNDICIDDSYYNFYYENRTLIEEGTTYHGLVDNFSATDYTKISIAYNKIVGYLLNGAQSYFYIKLDDSVKIASEKINVINSTFNNEIDTEVTFENIRKSMIKSLGDNGKQWNINKYALNKNTITATYYSDPVSYKLNYANKELTLYYDKEYQLKKIVDLKNEDRYDYSEKEGYSFVGWISQRTVDYVNFYYEGDFTSIIDTPKSSIDANPMFKIDSDYGYLFTDENVLSAFIGSKWYFSRDINTGVADYLLGATFEQTDFYIDGGWLVTDTSMKDTENYNFWGVNASKLSEDLYSGRYESNYFKDDGSGVLKLYPVWMANDYTLRITLNDVDTLDVDGEFTGHNGTTKTLFRINDTSYSFLNNYMLNLNNGFNFELVYKTGESFDRILMKATENAASTSEFILCVRYDTSEWYFTDITGNRRIYYQDLFKEGEVNADRYGYSFDKWLIGDNEFFSPTVFNNEFYQKCVAPDNDNIIELEELSGKVTYDYKDKNAISAHESPCSDSNRNQIVYIYGDNGEDFNLEIREEGSDYITYGVDYYGTKIYHFVTNKYVDGRFREAKISANWIANEYKVIVDNDEYEFADDGQGGVSDSPEDSTTILYKFDAYLYQKNKYYDQSGDMLNSQLAKDYLSQMPYRHGYEFAGWTLAYNKLYVNNNNYKNDITELKYGYENYWYEQLYYELNAQDGNKYDSNSRVYQGLCDDLLRYYNYYKVLDVDNSISDLNNEQTFILHYGQRDENASEKLGDVDKGNADGHYIVLYSNWTPMLYSVEVDLNIPENYDHISDEIFVGLFDSNDIDGLETILDSDGIFDNGIMTDFLIDENGIASFNYMYDNKKYKNLISNLSFKFYYGRQLKESFVSFEWEVEGYGGNLITKRATFCIQDLFVKLNNNKFNGWLLQVLKDNELVYVTPVGGHINVDEYYYGSFADDWRSVSNYGSIKLGGVNYLIYRDAVVEDFNEVIDPATGDKKEDIITERLYVEINGKRYYLPGIDHIDLDGNKNKNWNFNEEYMMKVHYVTENQNIEVGDEYYLYNTTGGAYYICDAYKDVYNEDGLLIRTYDRLQNKVFIYTYDADGKLINTQETDASDLKNLNNLLNENGELSSIFNTNSKLSGGVLTINNNKIFRLVADFSEIVNAEYDLDLQNNNNSSTAKVLFKGKVATVYYSASYLVDVDKGETSVIKRLYVFDEEIQKYVEIIPYYVADVSSDNLYPDYFDSLVTNERGSFDLDFNQDYLKLAILNDSGFNVEQSIYYDHTGCYFYDLKPNGLTFKHYLNGSFRYRYMLDDGSYAWDCLISDMSTFHHFTGLNEYSNPGLTAIFNEVATKKDTNQVIIEHTGNISGDASVGYTYENLNEFKNTDSKFGYNTNANVQIMPYFNGRYLTELTFEFEHIFEDEIIKKPFTKVAVAKKVNVKLTFDLFWDSENRTIGIEKIELWRMDADRWEDIKLVWSITRKETFDKKKNEIEVDEISGKKTYNFVGKGEDGNEIEVGYLDWWKDIRAIDIDNSVRPDRLYNFIESYFGKFIEYNQTDSEFFIQVGDYVEKEVNGKQGRKDYNPITLNLYNLKKDITLETKFSVQTFDVNVYSLLNDEYDSPIRIEGDNIETSYASKEELEKVIDYTTSSLSKDYRFDYAKGENPKYATIVDDSNSNFNYPETKYYNIPEGVEVEEPEKEGYNVPYGFFVYGYAITSNFVGDRPIDNAANLEIIKNPYYAFNYIYYMDLYDYADSELDINSKNSDLINASQLKPNDKEQDYEGDHLYLVQNSPMIGDPNKFLQSVRADLEVLYYSFGGLFFIDEENTGTGNIKFRAVTEKDELSYLNKDYDIYAYYYARRNASQTGFYAWDDEKVTYQRIEDMKDGYAYYKIDRVDNFVMNTDNTFTKTGSNAYNIMYTFKEIGIDTEKFAKLFDFSNASVLNEFETDELKKEYLEYLKLVAQTYWFMSNYGEAILYDKNNVEANVNIADLKYDEASKLYYSDDNGNGKLDVDESCSESYYVLKQKRDSSQTVYGASLYKKSEYKGGGYYEKVTDFTAFNPATDDVADYAVFNDYYVVYNDKYYKINIYKETALGSNDYYNPNKKHSINAEGLDEGNYVEIEFDTYTKTYYFNYDTLKLYEPGMIGVEVSDFSYQIKTPVNENYDISVIERTNGYGLYGITLNKIPDSSVGYWHPGSEFLFWAGITEENFKALFNYEANNTTSYGKVVTQLLDIYEGIKGKKPNPTESNYDEYMTIYNNFIDKLKLKLNSYTFEDLIKSGVLVKNFRFNKVTNAVELVELQFVVDLGDLPEIGRVPINVSSYFDILEAGSDVVSSIYAIQVYQKVEFSIDSEFSSGNANRIIINKAYYELYGDTIYYYCEDNDNFVRFAYLTKDENDRMDKAEDKASMLNTIISEYLEADSTRRIDGIVVKNNLIKTEVLDGDENPYRDSNGEIIYEYSSDGYIEKVLQYEDRKPKLDEYGYAIYEYSYGNVSPTTEMNNDGRTYLWAFYYKANMPEGSEPYVVAVAKKK